MPQDMLPNQYEHKRKCECDRPLPDAFTGDCVKCGHAMRFAPRVPPIDRSRLFHGPRAGISRVLR